MDHPFDEVVANAERQIARGATVFQKFTCVGCGQRLTIDVPNSFHTEGSCDRCGAVTNIRERGCNFMLIQPLTEQGVDEVQRMVLAGLPDQAVVKGD